jgi:hypothetical protein
MKARKVSRLKKTLLHTLILSLTFIVAWQATGHAATTVVFGDNTGNDFTGTVEDAIIYERSAFRDYNYGGRANFQAGEPSNTAWTTRSLIRFRDIAFSLGPDKVITSATMYLYCNSENTGGDYSISAYRTLLDWGEGSLDGGAGEVDAVCWNDAQYTGLSWNAAGCDSASDVTGEDSTADRRTTAEAMTTITGLGWFSWNLTTAVQKWYSGQWSEYGIILINDNEGTAGSLKQFLSSENPNDGGRPYLEVTYDTAIPPLTPSYNDSAHGNDDPAPGYGVNRSGTDYDIGDCAHCHETFDGSLCIVNELMLFAPMNPASQTDNFCFRCHTAIGGDQFDSISTNKSYSYNFAGYEDTDTYDDDIKEAFSHTADSGSSHHLSDIVNLFGQTLKDAAGNDWSLPEGTNPCRACHNPHLAQQNYPVVIEGGVLKTAISRPSRPNELWGDDSNERMSSVGGYHPPRWYQEPALYEPDRSDTTDGLNMPDYVRLCTDCHNKYNTIVSNNPRIPGGPRPLTKFNWGVDEITNYLVHGAKDGDAWHLRGPYSGLGSANITLSCIDCHEPHGSHEHIYLMRTSINGTELTQFDGEDDLSWGRLCNRCHIDYIGSGAKHSGAPPDCWGCHRHAKPATF